MAIKQTIQYHSPNRYFAGFLQSIISESGILASVEQRDGEITLLIDQTDKQLEAFNKLLGRYLPHSIFLGEINTIEEDESITPTPWVSADYPLAPCNRCMELINTPSSPHYLDEELLCSHYANLATTRYEDPTIFSPHYSEGAVVLLTNASKVNDLFIVTEDEIKALFSIEKPTLKVTIADSQLEELVGKKFVKVKAPYNNKSLLASINAKESEIDYLFFHQEADLDAVIVQKNLSIVRANRIATPLEPLNGDPVINRFANIQKEAKFEHAIGSYLSTHGISFIVSNELGTKRVINFVDFDLAQVMASFKASDKRTKLLANFATKYPTIANALDSQSIELY